MVVKNLDSGIYESVALMGGFLKSFAPMMGAFWSIPAPIMGTFLKILPHLGYKMTFSFHITQFLPIIGGLSTYDGCFFRDSPQRAFALRAAHP